MLFDDQSTARHLDIHRPHTVARNAVAAVVTVVHCQ